MKSLLKTPWKWLKKTLLWIFVLHLVYLLWCKWIFPPITLTQVNSVLSGYGLQRDYVSLNKVHPNARLAVIAAEDQLFAKHNGFDWESIEKAMEHNAKHPNRTRGASTISQQVAKNVFLWQGRSWFRKGLEVYFTFMIEWMYSKRRILELYLNVIETGEGVFGMEAAAQKYFGKPASKLTQTEAAMIAASLPNPKLYKVKPPGRWVSRRYPWVLKNMNRLRGSEGMEPLMK